MFFIKNTYDVDTFDHKDYIRDNLSECPQLVPNGWVPILESRDLSVRRVMSLIRFDKQLVVYRDSNGCSHVFDAYCPHLGANIAIGGTVDDNDIRCPFHGWTFNSNGQCSGVPGIEGK